MNTLELGQTLGFVCLVSIYLREDHVARHHAQDAGLDKVIQYTAEKCPILSQRITNIIPGDEVEEQTLEIDLFIAWFGIEWDTVCCLARVCYCYGKYCQKLTTLYLSLVANVNRLKINQHFREWSHSAVVQTPFQKLCQVKMKSVALILKDFSVSLPLPLDVICLHSNALILQELIKQIYSLDSRADCLTDWLLIEMGLQSQRQQCTVRLERQSTGKSLNPAGR